MLRHHLNGEIGRRVGGERRSGALFPDALAGAAHLAVQLDHLQDGLLAAAAQVVEHTLVLLGESVEHTEDVTWRGERRRRRRLIT